LNQELITDQLSQAFGYDDARIKAALANGLDDRKTRGHHLAFDDDSTKEILEWIEAQADKCKPITRTDLRHYCEANYSRSISRGWVDSFILRHRDDVTETTSAL
jgi:hypothetical protein